MRKPRTTKTAKVLGVTVRAEPEVVGDYERAMQNLRAALAELRATLIAALKR